VSRANLDVHVMLAGTETRCDAGSLRRRREGVDLFVQVAAICLVEFNSHL
jgi:hypothetical protein